MFLLLHRMRAIVAGAAVILSATSVAAAEVAVRVSGEIETVYAYARDRCDWPIPSRMTLPPPNFTSSP